MNAVLEGAGCAAPGALAMPVPAELQPLLDAADPATSRDPVRALAAARELRSRARTEGGVALAACTGVWVCQHLLRLGHYDEVLVEAAVLRPELDHALAAGLAATERREFLRVLALAACESAAFGLALEVAQELVRDSALLGEPGAALEAAFALAACFERMGDSWQAIRLLADAVQRHGGEAAGLPLLIALNGLAAILLGTYHRLAGAAPEAEVAPVLERARAAAEQARLLLGQFSNPVYEVAVLGNLGEVLMYQGELQAAEPLLRNALLQAGQRGLRAHGWRVRASLGAWLLAASRPGEARDLLETLVAEMGADAPQQTLIRAHHGAYRACRALGRSDAALAHFERVELLERRRASNQLRAQSELFVTRAEAQRAQSQVELAQAEALQQRERAVAAVERAERDPLTGVGNRHLLERRFAELLPAAERAGRPFAVVMLDVDHFKAINDLHGHAGGDAVLMALAALLRDNLRAADVLARLGGEEFVLLLPDLPPEQAGETCQRLRAGIERHSWPGLPAGLRVTVSIGLAAAPRYDASELLRRADVALYAAKRGGRNRLSVAP